MNSLDQATDLVIEKWDAKTLEDFRQDALRETNGIVFESIRSDNGPRCILLVCVTAQEKLPVFERGLHLSEEDETTLDWTSTTLGDVLLKMGSNAGLRYEDLKDQKGKRIALILFAMEPQSVSLVEKMFNFPK